MSGILLQQNQDIDYDGFYDGQQKIIPNDTELACAVTDGFVGIEEGKSLQVCMISIVVTTPGEFFGQKYKYNAKIYDMDAAKRDLAMRNLGVLDAQAGFPMTNGQIELTTESIQNYWVGVSEARVKFGLFTTDPDGEPDGQAREINFIRGFGYLREKMVQAGGQVKNVPENAPTQQDIDEQSAERFDDSDIDF
jgi:hypothetical protein